MKQFSILIILAMIGCGSRDWMATEVISDDEMTNLRLCEEDGFLHWENPDPISVCIDKVCPNGNILLRKGKNSFGPNIVRCLTGEKK